LPGEENYMQNGKIIIYQSPDGETSIDVTVENETVWLTQAQLIDLFQRDQSVISRHIKTAFQLIIIDLFQINHKRLIKHYYFSNKLI